MIKSSQAIDSAFSVLQTIRGPEIAQRVVFVGGLGGNGKTMLTPIIGSLDRVEIQKFNYFLEHICSLQHLGKLSEDATQTMIRMLVDLDIYNMMMARETNFRPSDLSSVFSNPRPWRYVKRAFQSGDEAVLERIQKEKPILHFVVHDLLSRSNQIFSALGNRAVLIEMVRHPLLMIKQWEKNVEQFYSDGPVDPREFGVWFSYRGHSLPWFVHGWEDLYLSLSATDRAIHIIDRNYRMANSAYQALSEENKKNVIFLCFERFVFNPWPDLKRIESMLGTTSTAATKRELKRQRVPRKRLTAGIDLPIYRRYGWQPPKESTDREELNKIRDYVVKKASSNGMETLDQLIVDYEARYLQGLI